MFFQNLNLYYITIALQAICAIHCIRKGSQGKWIWLIIFVPLIGSIAYIFTEIFTRNQLRGVQSGVASVINPNGNIKKLENRLKFTDTFNNRVLLADAYLSAGLTDKAIELYESSLTGAFSENEHVLMQLIVAYYEIGHYEAIIAKAKKIYRLPQFARSRAHLFYVLALEKTGNIALAEAEFETMKGRFSNYESRYEYGLFLARNNRPAEARKMFEAIVDEAAYLSAREKIQNKTWFSKTRQALKKMGEMVQ
jgi:hypothetical protein